MKTAEQREIHEELAKEYGETKEDDEEESENTQCPQECFDQSDVSS